MSKNIISISLHPNFRPKGQRSRKRLFDLGRHWYSGAPGLSWETNYWVKKIKKGSAWELYCSLEGSLSVREYNGIWGVNELRNYFEEINFELSEDEWLWMGLGRGAELIVFPQKPRKIRRMLFL
jgi:hypothetical protein